MDNRGVLSFRIVGSERAHPPGTFEHFGRALDRCESYIERRFLVALLFSEAFGFVAATDGAIAEADDGSQLAQQVDAPPYRLDFALWDVDGVVRLCIELDGHDFHERTADQAEHDRSRDRRLLAAGWLVIRFTGREVTRNPMACAREALHVFARLRAQRGPGLVKTTARARVESAALDESATKLIDPEAAWEAELEAARNASEVAKARRRAR